MQSLVWAVSLVLMGGIALVFLIVAAGASRPGGDAATIATHAYAWRARLFWLVLLVGAAISIGTLWNWPFASYAYAAPEPDLVIHATGHQWSWKLDQSTAEVGQLVEFQVTSADVNHGFALYGDEKQLIAQTQAMPGYVNKLRLRFTEPGDYEVLCLEYCGLAHHAMRAVIKVTAP